MATSPHTLIQRYNALIDLCQRDVSLNQCVLCFSGQNISLNVFDSRFCKFNRSFSQCNILTPYSFLPCRPLPPIRRSTGSHPFNDLYPLDVDYASSGDVSFLLHKEPPSSVSGTPISLTCQTVDSCKVHLENKHDICKKCTITNFFQY